MGEPAALVERRDHTMLITFNRPEVRNAVNGALTRAVGEALDEADADTGIRAVVLTGAGDKAFCAGADLKEVARGEFSTEGFKPHWGFAGCVTHPIAKPVVAAVNGFALGGGCELAMACHIRIAADVAKFGQPELKLGLIPGYGGTQRLPRLVGKGRALQLILTGETIDAQEALRIGLVNAVVPGAELIATARKWLGQMLANGPIALALAIETIDRGLDMPLEAAIALEADNFGRCAGTEDMREGARAFLARRAPNFTGR